MAEPILRYIAERLVDKLASFVGDELSLVWEVKDELLKLQKTLAAISAVIADAEQRQSQEQSLRVWLEDLKGVLYDFENALDEFECQALRKQVIKQGNLRGKLSHFFSSSNPLAFRLKMGHRIKDINKRLDDITAVKNAFNLNQQPNPGGSSRTISRETHSHVHLPEVVGRDIDRDAIVECLMGPNMIK
ncbi:disease resistance protein RGA2-like [Punica granatum]|uniref:Disease resistance protein RGA2-like n=2 Tax=Punica granatum TaxID=22663 RepID=A0A218WRU2_PUNGR|nr:disease resistance protein RGA2-like [Punica granatum]XP_031403568.1 disease resistance protein RGA2-like [Punica granatum]OWM74692.1 hypothetical protein CDL15_Pgr004655 [Punica granatum]